MDKLYNKLLYHSLTLTEIEKLNPDAKVYVYTELNNINNIKDLFDGYRKVIVLYLLASKTSGHYVCMFLDDNNKINFFDSLGYSFDDEIDTLSDEQRIEYDEQSDNLHRLLDQYEPITNQYIYQNNKYDTCGFWVTSRLKHSNLDDNQYANLFNNIKNNETDLFMLKDLFNK